jgi:hypothetical protein
LMFRGHPRGSQVIRSRRIFHPGCPVVTRRPSANHSTSKTARKCSTDVFPTC